MGWRQSILRPICPLLDTVPPFAIMAAREPCSDFIFLAEMCERNGPVVVEAFPRNSPVPADLPVRLFSCDMYGASAHDGIEDFVLQRDSFCILRLSPQLPQQQQLQLQIQPALAQLGPPAQPPQQHQEDPLQDGNAYAAVHHFQLCEMSGRGLIRKVCVAFVTSDTHKITRHMSTIGRQLANVARCVCRGNVAAFKADVAAILADLRQLAQPSCLDASPDLKEALPGLVRQYELLASRPVVNPALAVPTKGIVSADPPLSCTAEAAAAQQSIPSATPLERAQMLQAFGRPIEVWRPFMSTLTRERQQALSAALLEAHSVCALAPDVLWMLSEEARFLSPGDMSGDSLHSSACDVALGSLSAFTKRSMLAARAPAPPAAATDRPLLEFHSNEAVSVLLRHHILGQKAKEDALERTQALLKAATISSKQPFSRASSGRPSLSVATPLSAVELVGLQETRQLFNEHLFKNVVFALLKGENVLIRSKPDEQPLVVGIVRALSIFIPQNVLYRGTKPAGATSAMYQEWRETPLDICDLGSVKLAGGPKSVDVHERARAYVARIDIDDKNITAWIPRYRTDERVGLVHAIVGKKAFTDKWSNEVLVAHVCKEIVNLGRNIMQYIFLHTVPRGRSLLASKSREQAEYVGKTLGVQDEVAAAAAASAEEVKMPKRKPQSMGPAALSGALVDIDSLAEVPVSVV